MLNNHKEEALLIMLTTFIITKEVLPLVSDYSLVTNSLIIAKTTALNLRRKKMLEKVKILDLSQEERTVYLN